MDTIVVFCEDVSGCTGGADGNTLTEGGADGNTLTEGADGNTLTEGADGNTLTEGADGNTLTEGATGLTISYSANKYGSSNTYGLNSQGIPMTGASVGACVE